MGDCRAAALLSGAMNEAALYIVAQSHRDLALEQVWSELVALLESLRTRRD